MIHGMMIVRNENSRKLETEYSVFTEVLCFMQKLTDRLVIVDDSSDDDTFKYINSFADEAYKMEARMWDKKEVSLRQKLWDKTISKVNHGDWIICLDADEVIDDPQGLKYLLNNTAHHIDGIGFRLFDMWDMGHYRDDQHWKAHNFPWPMAVRYDANKEYVWTDKALHCGRFPANASERMLPTLIPIKHYGWALEEDRKKKYDRYMRIDGDGKHGILAQYESILDPNPNLVKFEGV